MLFLIHSFVPFSFLQPWMNLAIWFKNFKAQITVWMLYSNRTSINLSLKRMKINSFVGMLGNVVTGLVQLVWQIEDGKMPESCVTGTMLLSNVRYERILDQVGTTAFVLDTGNLVSSRNKKVRCCEPARFYQFSWILQFVQVATCVMLPRSYRTSWNTFASVREQRRLARSWWVEAAPYYSFYSS